jgi:hypothetical protein
MRERTPEEPGVWMWIKVTELKVLEQMKRQREVAWKLRN